MTICLDAWAVLAWLDREACAAEVRLAIESDGAVMSWINLGEVAYQYARRRDSDEAAAFVHALRSRVRVEEPTGDRVLQAAWVKAISRVSYADAFAIVTAIANDAELFTGDPEILKASTPGLRIRDLRAP